MQACTNRCWAAGARWGRHTGPLPVRYTRGAVRVHALLPGPEHLQQAVSGLSAAVAGHTDKVAHAANQLYAVAEDAAVQAAAATASSSSSGGGGPVDILANAFESLLRVLEDGLERAHVPYAYGFAIILLTVMVKAATYPLSRKSMESTMAIQALQPRVKELQARYANDPEALQLETARLYRDNQVNPLAGCLPTLATIPVFIGLYRALTKAADDGLLTSGFFWIPSLGGPTSMASRQAGAGLSWLFPFVDGAPPIGWSAAGAYLVLPVLLVVSQYISQKVVSPQQNSDPNQAGAQAVLKFIPFMIGWFSLNVPSGLTLYWLVNNILSTGQQLYMKRTIKVGVAGAGAAGGGAAGAVIDTTATPVVAPKEERVKRVTGKELGARKKKGGGGGAADSLDETTSGGAVPAAPSTSGASAGGGGGGGGGGARGAKFRARKAREAAAKASSQAANGSALQREPAQGVTATATSEPELKVPDAPPPRD